MKRHKKNSLLIGKLVLLILGILTTVMVTGCASLEEADEKDTGKAAEAAREDVQEESDSGSSGQINASGLRERERGRTSVTMADLLKESGNGDKTKDEVRLPDTVLWFNATYAVLTYSNGCDWRLVSGFERTEENVDIIKAMLWRDWNVLDRESALETVDSLVMQGHREKCRECMEQLEEWKLLDLGEIAFLEKFLEMDVDENPARYVIAYYMHQNGIEPEYMAAWDLCRVNQLYAYYYMCGFMDYEEAMDASLGNSLILQEKYESWEEMMDAYMLGYQFWKGDLILTEDSPAQERYRYYEMLRDREDNPYTLEWKMELEKSW